MALIKGMKVPIPPDSHKNPDGKVVQVKPAGPGERWPHKRLIGKVPIEAPGYKEGDYKTEDGIQLMIPNDAYREEYKDEFAKYQKTYGIKDTLPPEVIAVGLYLLILGIAYKLGVYQLLCEVFSVTLANAIMDLAMYYILCSDNTISNMAAKMKRELLFSVKAYDKDWYADEFKKYAIDYNPDSVFGDHSVREFMRRWTKTRIDSGLEDTYISLDGTNFDCQSGTAGACQNRKKD